MQITFTDTTGVDPCYAPIPASRCLPEWYKSSPEYLTGEKIIFNGETPHTIKKCMPVFDAMTSGYVICTYSDIQVTRRNGLPYYEWPFFEPIGFHPVEQAPKHPDKNEAPYPKWLNPWAIRTPSGYSCLFIPPMHNPNGIFTVMPGIVDTDSYNLPVNFPFTLNDINWEGIIPAGTPMVQVIPFRRDEWKMRLGNNKDLKRQNSSVAKLRSLFFNSYKRQFWTRKQYK